MASDSSETQAVIPQPDDLELRKEWARIRAIMYDNTHLHLSSAAADEGRWLTDQYVMLDVTDSPAVVGLRDGQYKLQAGKGFLPITYNPAGEVLVQYPSALDLDAYFDRLTDAEWAPATPSQWSVAEHPGKAMLFTVDGTSYLGCAATTPALMGESTWTTLHRHFEDATAEYAVDGVDLDIFRILAGDMVVAYVAGIQVPDGQEGIAQAIAELTTVDVSTSNREEAA